MLSFERYCAEIVAQTDVLRFHVRDADLTAPVPTTPGWNLGQLLRHLGGGHRWAERIVTTRAAEPLAADDFREVSARTDEDPAALTAWLADGAGRLADSLRAAGLHARMWKPVPGEQPPAEFWARRFAHETLVRRADATLALGAEFGSEQDLAMDALDEWMELGSMPHLLEQQPEKRELLGPDRTLHFHATDAAPEASAEWVVDLTGGAITWRRAHEKAAVAVRGPLTDLLLIVYRRLPPGTERVEVLGDEALLHFWLERVTS